MFLALPQLPLLLLLIYLFRPALQVMLGEQGGIFVLIVVVIGGLRWMPLARLVRAQFLSLREKEFVEAARALGASRLRLVVRHIMPNAHGAGDRRGHHRGGERHYRGIDAVVPGRRLSTRRAELGAHAVRRAGLSRRSRRTGRCFRAWPSSLPCCRSTSSATGCATRSTRGGLCRWRAIHLARLGGRGRRASSRGEGRAHSATVRYAPHPAQLRSPTSPAAGGRGVPDLWKSAT